MGFPLTVDFLMMKFETVDIAGKLDRSLCPICKHMCRSRISAIHIAYLLAKGRISKQFVSE
jgi:hypothetical protein